MRFLIATLLGGALIFTAAFVGAQPPGGKDGPPGKKGGGGGDPKAFVERMMAFDKNKDGKLTKDEITDERLLRLFDKIDTNKDGVVTKEELEAYAAKEMQGGGGRGQGGPGGGPGGPGGRGPGGFGGPGGPGGRFGGPPPIGQVMPPFVQEMLQISDTQKKQLDELQKEMDAKLDKILTDEQRKQLKEMKERGPGGFGGGPGGFGPPKDGPGGPPKKD
jgi:Spy/CpxP family protein refolding chaperone